MLYKPWAALISLSLPINASITKTFQKTAPKNVFHRGTLLQQIRLISKETPGIRKQGFSGTYFGVERGGPKRLKDIDAYAPPVIIPRYCLYPRDVDKGSCHFWHRSPRREITANCG